MILERGKTWRTSARYVSQSVILKSDDKPVPRWSIHVMRRKHLYGPTEQRGYHVFLHLGRIRAEIGT